ncbi:hypothetical protein [Adhaeribacter pallidiroseus]|uniref:SH3b domain-containing protein n=1 Tax=Adhaeribacter pallidiroseus TaxID=2072847 RepID=A0A369QQD4_9BACT|nr:hypothetical protein [Adhaeribacter pallidiroseus]RDC66512.1 hypothetical protein AHMF7616_05143 [Adhaeribacter pallidiroseus]
MKKALFTLAIALQVFAASAHKKTGEQELTVYKQPSKDTQVIKVISDSDEVALVRPFNNKWSIVTINKEVGYMSTFQLSQYNKQQRAAGLAKGKANRTKQNSRS